MPRLIAFGTIGMLAISAGLYALAGGGGKVLTLPVVTQGPAQNCVDAKRKDQPNLPVVSRNQNFICYQNDNEKIEGAYISLATARQAIEALGGKLTSPPDGSYRLEAQDGSTSFRPSFRQGNDYYIPATGLLGMLIRNESRHAGKKIVLRHYHKPELSIDGLTFKLSQRVNEPVGRQIYSEVGDMILSQLVYKGKSYSSTVSYNAVGDVPHTVRTSLKADEAVLVLARLGDNEFKSVIRPVGLNGELKFYFLPGELRFVNSAEALTPPQSGQATPIMLVRLTNVPLNNLQSGIFLPK